MNNVKIEDPKSWDDVKNMENPFEKEKWKIVNLDEMNALWANDTWELVEALPGTRMICWKWAFKSKYNSHDSLD